MIDNPLSAMFGFVGMFYGARRLDLVEGIVRYALLRGFLIALAISTVFVVLAPWLVAPFTDSESIRRIGVQYLRYAALVYPAFPFSIMIGRALQGLGRGTPELVLSLLRVLLIAVPLATAFAFIFDRPIHFVWMSMIAGSWISALVALQWWRLALRATMGEPDEPPAGPEPLAGALEGSAAS